MCNKHIFSSTKCVINTLQFRPRNLPCYKKLLERNKKERTSWYHLLQKSIIKEPFFHFHRRVLFNYESKLQKRLCGPWFSSQKQNNLHDTYYETLQSKWNSNYNWVCIEAFWHALLTVKANGCNVVSTMFVTLFYGSKQYYKIKEIFDPIWWKQKY